MSISKKISHLERIENYYLIETNGPTIKLMFLTDDIIRIRASYDGKFREKSYALVMTAWDDELDAFMKNERKRVKLLDIDVIEEKDYYQFKTKSSVLKLYKEPYGIELYNLNGEVIYSDILGRAFKRDLQNRVYHYSKADLEHDYYYGFGESTGKLNKNGTRVRIAPRDSIGYDAAMTSPLYKHIPFYIKLNSLHKNAIGLFYNNTYESAFDMGCERSGYWPRYSYFVADGGDIDLFLINGPTVEDVVKRYTDLTGKTAFSPQSSLGYLGSTMYYVELPEKCDEEIIQFIKKNKEEGIPIDNFHLSSGYTVDEESGKRYVFTWNKKRFSNPKNFFSQMHQLGVTVSSNVKPGVLLGNPNYASFDSVDGFIKNPDNDASYVDQWWGGLGSFVDFTNPKAREVWKNHLKESLLNFGTASLWNDNCEYDSVDDKGARCCFDGSVGTVDELKAVQPLIMAHVGKEAIMETHPNVRPYCVNRSGFAGIQRYSSTWCGDNFTSWKTLKYNIATILGMSLSGVANNGSDIGGFWGKAPDAELFTRWVQNGIFQPRFSIHSCNTNNTVTQPWMYSKYKEIIKKAIEFRYEMIPYLYSLLYEAHIEGTPILRPLFYHFQEDIQCYNESFHFMLGDSLLVANVFNKEEKIKKIYLPKGCDWYDFYTNKKYCGGESIDIEVNIESIPIFIRDSAIITMTKGCMCMNLEPVKKLKIIIGGSGTNEHLHFEDDGNSFNYLKGEGLETKINVQGGEQVKIELNRNGHFNSKIEEVEFEVINIEKSAYWVSVNGKKIPMFLNRSDYEKSELGWYYSTTMGRVLVKHPKWLEVSEVVVSFAHFDLIGM